MPKFQPDVPLVAHALCSLCGQPIHVEAENKRAQRVLEKDNRVAECQTCNPACFWIRDDAPTPVADIAYE